MSDLFEIVGVKPELAEQQVPEKENRWYDTIPWLSVIILILIVGGCLFCKRIMTKDPSYMDLKNYTIAPCKEFLFGTDTMGRDIFSMIWYGGRQSLFNCDICRYCNRIWYGKRHGTGLAGYAAHEGNRDSAEHSESSDGYFSAGHSWKGKCIQSVFCNRDYELDEYSQNYQNRSAAAAKQ